VSPSLAAERANAVQGRCLSGAYPPNVLIGLVILLGIALVELAAFGAIIRGFIVTASRLRRSRLARPSAVTIRLWTSLIALVVGLGLLVLGNAWLVLRLYDQGRPTQAQVVGTWTDSDGANGAALQILPNGTFTATALPPDTDSSTGRDVTVQALPADEHGTWHMTKRDGGWYVLCSLSGGPQFQLYIVPPTSPDGPLSANFTYAGVRCVPGPR
jgi:hypothetical protein